MLIFNSTFGKQLRALRRVAEFSQRDLAIKVGIDFTYLSKIENGVIRPPSELVIRKVAHELATKLKGRDETELAYELMTLAGKLPSDLVALIADSPGALAYLKKLSTEVASDSSFRLPDDAANPTPERGQHPESLAASNVPVPRSGLENRATPPQKSNDSKLLFFNDSQRTEVLRKSAIFSDLNSRDILELGRLAAGLHLKSGQSLFSEGDQAEFCYVVVSGLVKILKHSPSGKDLIIDIYGPGETLGFTRVFDENPHSSCAQTMLDTEVMVIKRNDFLFFLRKYPDLGFKILARMLNAVSKRRAVAAVHLTQLVAEPADCRLARVLLTLHLKVGAVIPLSRCEIAEMAGTTTETASRFVSRLSREGVLDSFREKVIVLQHDRLRQLAQVAVNY